MTNTLQFLNIGNDIAARATSPCIWIINPRETGKVLQNVLKYRKIKPVVVSEEVIQRRQVKEGPAAIMDIYTGEEMSSSKSTAV